MWQAKELARVEVRAENHKIDDRRFFRQTCSPSRRHGLSTLNRKFVPCLLLVEEMYIVQSKVEAHLYLAAVVEAAICPFH